MKLKSYPKINLFLTIGPRQENGYHLVDTVLLKIKTLFDELHFESSEQLSLEVYGFDLDQLDPEKNLVIRALRAFEQVTQKSCSFKIQVHKKIPPGSGLGGGSSNAASTLFFLNQYHQNPLNADEMMNIGASLGADVPFFLSGFDCALAGHYGEKIIQELPTLPESFHLELIFNEKSQETASAYQAWDQGKYLSTGDLNAFLAALKSQNPSQILKALHNDFEQILKPQDLLHMDPKTERKLLAGSGSANVLISFRQP